MLLTFVLRCAGLRLRLLLRADGGDKLPFACKFPAGAAAAFPVENLRVAGGDLTEARKRYRH